MNKIVLVNLVAHLIGLFVVALVGHAFWIQSGLNIVVARVDWLTIFLGLVFVRGVVTFGFK